MRTPVPAAPPALKTSPITCMADCGYSGHLIYPTLWVWPTTGIMLALGWVAFRMLWNRKALLK
jgi:hypothetical protein